MMRFNENSQDLENETVDLSPREVNIICFNMARELLEHYGEVAKEDVSHKAASIVKGVSEISDAEWTNDYANATTVA